MTRFRSHLFTTTALLFLALALGPVPAGSQGYQTGGGGKRIERASWGLCIGSNCAVMQNITVNWVAVAPGKIEKCYASAKTAPTGAALIVDINKNGSTIFGANRLQVADGQTAGITAEFSSARKLAEGDLLTIDIDQIGSTEPGKDLFVTCRIALQ